MDNLKLWNGMVGDFQEIDENIFTETFVKESEDYIRKSIRHESLSLKKKTNLTKEENILLEKEVKNRLETDEYTPPNRYVTEEDFISWYGNNKKEFIILQPKIMNKQSFDRAGSIYY